MSITSLPNRDHQRTARRGFSLIELVVVILILGVIAAIAAPRMFNTTDQAKSHSTRQTLAVIRNAIEIYRANNSDYPPSTDTATFVAAIRPYLNGPIPKPEVPAGKTAAILMDATALAAGYDAAADDDEDAGWVYKQATGSFRVNATTGEPSTW